MHIINKFLLRINMKLIKLPPPPNRCSNIIRINIGSGNWSCDGWTNLDYPSEWYNKAQKKHEIVPYNIREDNIPYEDNSVDVIYCSHVIEHIENEYIQKMFNECYRVLKKEGIIRICCPDAEFLYEVSRHKTDYWQWRRKWFQSDYYIKINEPRNVDFLVREIATPKLLNYKHSINQTDYIEQFDRLDMYSFFNYLTGDLSYRKEYPGDHINWWTFTKAKNMLFVGGFKYVIRSKWSGSVSKEMKDIYRFDTTYPLMSLYVEAIKL